MFGMSRGFVSPFILNNFYVANDYVVIRSVVQGTIYLLPSNWFENMSLFFLVAYHIVYAIPKSIRVFAD